MKEEGPQTLLHEFYALQEERVKVYKKLDEAHKAYLETSPDYNFAAYRQVVHDSAEDFNCISKKIIRTEAVFRNEHQKADVADCLKKIQEAEQDKLEKTAALQLTKQRLKDEPDNEEHKREVSDLQNRLAGIMEKITDTMEDLKYETEGL